MKKQDFDYLKSELLKDSFLCNFLTIIRKPSKAIVCYQDKVIVILECGFAYLIDWYCEGYIGGVQAKHMNNICNEYNGRF